MGSVFSLLLEVTFIVILNDILVQSQQSLLPLPLVQPSMNICFFLFLLFLDILKFWVRGPVIFLVHAYILIALEQCHWIHTAKKSTFCRSFH